MAATLKRNNTIWPGAEPLNHEVPLKSDVTGPKSSATGLATKGPSRELSAAERLQTTPSPFKRRANDINRTSSRLEEPSQELIDSASAPLVPVPQPILTKEVKTWSQSSNTDPVDIRKTNRNPHVVPTALALDQSIVVTPRYIWDLYEAIECCSNQGDSHSGNVFLSRRRRTTNERQEGLFVVKEQRWTGNHGLKHFTKPKCPHLVELLGAFSNEDTLWTLYEEMDLSLDQIFALDCDPWSISPGTKDSQIAAIAAPVSF